MLSRNQIKFITSLKIKKYRKLHNCFFIEGDKIVGDLLQDGRFAIRHLVATPEWLANNKVSKRSGIVEISEANTDDFKRISSLETPSGVMAILDIPVIKPDKMEISTGLSLVLENVQDPGNIGTIIRTADWFGIHNIFCSEECADCYNPKVLQATMGAIFNVNMFYTDLYKMLGEYSQIPGFVIYGTFMQGINIQAEKFCKKGMIVFGNESRGITNNLIPFIHKQLTIPPFQVDGRHVESLNVASAVAIVCASFRNSG